MCIKEGGPPVVSKRGCPRGRRNDVGEHHRREHPVELSFIVADAKHETLDIVKERRLITDPEEMIISGILHEFGTRYLLRHLSSGINWEVLVSDASQHKRWHMYRGEDMTDIHAVVHPFESHR